MRGQCQNASHRSATICLAWHCSCPNSKRRPKNIQACAEPQPNTLYPCKTERQTQGKQKSHAHSHKVNKNKSGCLQPPTHTRAQTSGKWKRRTQAHQGISLVSKFTGSSFVLGMGNSSSNLRRAISVSITCMRQRGTQLHLSILVPITACTSCGKATPSVTH
jgi:hypothetical protein